MATMGELDESIERDERMGHLGCCKQTRLISLVVWGPMNRD